MLENILLYDNQQLRLQILLVIIVRVKFNDYPRGVGFSLFNYFRSGESCEFPPNWLYLQVI